MGANTCLTNEHKQQIISNMCLVWCQDSSAKQLTECVDLLLQLNEPAEELCQEFLSQ